AFRALVFPSPATARANTRHTALTRDSSCRTCAWRWWGRQGGGGGGQQCGPCSSWRSGQWTSTTRS
ncbi:unnamed protein product, partial [Closterium sp. Yama58-4]